MPYASPPTKADFLKASRGRDMSFTPYGTGAKNASALRMPDARAAYGSLLHTEDKDGGYRMK